MGQFLTGKWLTFRPARAKDELYLQYPFYGARQMVRHLAREGVHVGRHRVRRLMRPLGLEAIYRKLRLSVAHPEHRVYPYLLRGPGDRPSESGAVRGYHLHPGFHRQPAPPPDDDGARRLDPCAQMSGIPALRELRSQREILRPPDRAIPIY